MTTPDAGVLARVVARANQPEAGPPITTAETGGMVTFVCETWRPILEARIQDAIASELGEEQQHFQRA